MKTLQSRIGRIEARLSSLGRDCPDFSQLTDEELEAAIQEIHGKIIGELGEVEGRAEIARIEAMSDRELDEVIKQWQ